MRLVNIWFGLLGLKSSKVRSALTVLGVIVGVAAVIVIVSLGDGMKRYTQERLEQMTSGTIEIRPGGPAQMMMDMSAVSYREPGGVVVVERDVVAGGGPPARLQPQLLESDVEALQRQASTVNGLSPRVELYAPMTHNGRRLRAGQIMGLTPEYLRVHEREVKVGRFITAFDDATAAPVAVLDEELADEVFGADTDPLGKIVHISANGVPHNFAIVGVLKSKGEQWWGPSRNALMVPLRTARVRLKQQAGEGIDIIVAKVDTRVPEERRFAVAQINTILATKHGIEAGSPEDFSVRDTLQYSEEETQVIGTMTLVLSLIAGISLLVGSIGLMNIMLVSVSERTAEIGLRRAMGAKKTDVLTQFLAEALLLSLAGGSIGFMLGFLGSQLVGNMIEPLQGMIEVTPNIVITATVISSAVGILAGSYPAWRAARLQPTEALRRI